MYIYFFVINSIIYIFICSIINMVKYMKASFRSETKNLFKIAKWQVIFKFITSLFIRGILLVIPILFSAFINYLTKGDTHSAILMLGFSIILTFIHRFVECLNQYAFYKLYTKIYTYYNGLAVDKTNENSTYSLSRFSLGQYTNLAISDVDVISSFYSNGVLRVVQILEFIFIYIYFFTINRTIFLVALILSITLLFIALKFGNKLQVYNKNRKQKLDQMTMGMHEYFNGVKDMKSFNIFSNIAPNIKHKTEEYLDAHSKYNKKAQYSIHVLLFVIELFRLLTMGYSINLVVTSVIEIGTVLVIYNYYQKIIDNFSTILTINIEFRNLKVSLQRFYKIVEFSHEKEDKNIVLSNIKGDIKFEDILYGYKDNPTLNRVSFDIKHNSMTVITGLGTGKNGVLELLLKFNRAHEGNILIDNVNINDIDDNNYYDIISSVRKQPIFYNMTIMDNLKLIDNNEKRIKDICKKLKIDDKIEELKNGFNTILVNETSVDDSLKGMLGIARILLKDTKIMLFEEAINGLNSVDKDIVLKILKDLKKNHTIVIISNDDSIVDMADAIIYIKNDHLSSANELYIEDVK